MRIFAFNPDDYREHYARHGWAYVQNGIAPEFLDALREFTSRSFTDHRVEGESIGGRKDQALYEFPEETNFPDEVFDTIAAVCGLDRDGMTLSERHIKAYDADAPPDPVAHKDRNASQVSVGLSIEIPTGSRLVLFPEDDVWPNPFDISGALIESLAPERHPSVVLRDAREVVIEDSPGDVVMFRGAELWHLRRHAAGAVNLYLKMNDFGSDPLGEDPRNAGRAAGAESESATAGP